MADRRIILAENNRTATRGIKQTGEAEFLAYQRDDDTLSYIIDYSNWLGSDTVSSISRAASGATVSATSNTTTTATQSLTGQGYVDITMTSAAGLVRVDRICIEPRTADMLVSDPYR